MEAETIGGLVIFKSHYHRKARTPEPALTIQACQLPEGAAGKCTGGMMKKGKPGYIGRSANRWKPTEPDLPCV